MTHETLDDHLDRSAPSTRPATKSDIDAMIAEARPASARSFRPRILVAAGLTAVLASGGVGVAFATDGFSWAPWAQDPIGAVHFTMANGFHCELRYSALTGGTDPARVSEVNSIRETWYQSTDVLAAARSLVPAALEEIGPIELQPGETLETLPEGEAEHREFVRQWLAWDMAISNAEWQELTASGVDPEDSGLGGSEGSSQIKCFDENHEPYTFGSGE
jgi:hypothetical protein